MSHMPDEKISIIVPIYNVEPYLCRCLDSIIGQTYRNLEIILVDDGSPDNCGTICDEYAAKDERVKVIHKANGGVSSARNAGLAVAAGDWLGWVDPDDWVETDMFEYLLNGAREYAADIAVCGRVEVYPDHQHTISWEKTTVLRREEAIEVLLEDSLMRNYLCDKLWKRRLFQDIYFPVGRNFEDVAVTYRLFEKINMVACLPECKYFYLQRRDGIVRNKDLGNIITYYETIKERYLYLSARYPEFQKQMECGLVIAIARIWEVCVLAPIETRKEYWEQLKAMSVFSREHPAAIADAAQDLGLAGKIILKLTRYTAWWAFVLAWIVNRIYVARHGDVL